MGVSCTVYLGPYAECVRGKKKINTYDVIEEFQERLTTINDSTLENSLSDTQIYYPNVAFGVDRECHNLSDESKLVEITPYTIATEKTRFIVFFKAELAVLRSHYGDSSVTVKWGLLVEYW